LTLSLIVVLLLVAVFLTGIIIGVRVRHNIEEQKDLNYYIQENAAKYNIPYDVIYAVIETESSFRADAVSSTGARGLMQITKITLEELKGRLGTHYSMNDLFDPKINIRLGTFYLSILYKRFGDFETVYAAYNAGPTIVAEWLADQNFSNDGKTLIHDKIPYPETKRYVEKVIAFQENYLESHNS
jgi:soluble lytic murein transglycosylase